MVVICQQQPCTPSLGLVGHKAQIWSGIGKNDSRPGITQRSPTLRAHERRSERCRVQTVTTSQNRDRLDAWRVAQHLPELVSTLRCECNLYGMRRRSSTCGFLRTKIIIAGRCTNGNVLIDESAEALGKSPRLGPVNGQLHSLPDILSNVSQRARSSI